MVTFMSETKWGGIKSSQQSSRTPVAAKWECYTTSQAVCQQ